MLHSDKGTDEEGNHEKVKMEELGITPSYNWPRVSNHNPFSKATFRPLKYGVNWPSQGGKDLAEGRIWVQNFVNGYNNEHSRINFVTSHNGMKEEMEWYWLTAREAKAVNPLRWSKDVQNCNPIGPITLNPDRAKNKAA